MKYWLSIVLVTMGMMVVSTSLASAQDAIAGTTKQGSGSIGLSGKISTDAPKQGATISTPTKGASFTSLPVTVNGLCPKGLLVKIFDNNVFVGSVTCDNGSYSIQVDLFEGQNDLVARVYDALDQPGPDSNVVNVNYNSGQFVPVGQQLTVTSPYAERGANPGEQLTWPIVISGGTGPYAISVDWGDNGPQELESESQNGTITLTHTYKTAGTYRVIIIVKDSKGNQAILTVIGVANGAVQSGTTGSGSSKNGSGAANSPGIVKTQLLWWPAIAMIPLIILTFFVGSRYRLHALRNQIERQRGDSAKA